MITWWFFAGKPKTKDRILLGSTSGYNYFFSLDRGRQILYYYQTIDLRLSLIIVLKIKHLKIDL